MNAMVQTEGATERALSIGYATPADLLRVAFEQNADLDRLQQLMDMQERWQANQARMAFHEAMAEFKKDAPTILKNKLVSFGETSYMHAELADVTDAIVPGLARVGISSSWKPEQLAGGTIRVTCVLTHKLGHSESTPLESAADASGKKNSIQSVGSTITYLERYTLLMATGLSTKSLPDDDGRGSQVECITEQQCVVLRDYITETKASETKFLAYMGVGSIAAIPAGEYNKAIAALKHQEKARKKADAEGAQS